MRVKYNDFVSQVSDDMDPNEIMKALRQSFSELLNGTYEILTEGTEKVMKVFLRTGNKA